MCDLADPFNEIESSPYRLMGQGLDPGAVSTQPANACWNAARYSGVLGPLKPQ